MTSRQASDGNRVTTAIDRRIGMRVRARRLEISMSQEKLADILGVTFQQVQKYEKGINRISVARYLDICAALDWPPAESLQGLLAASSPSTEDNGQSAIERVLAAPGGFESVNLLADLDDKLPHAASILRTLREITKP